MALLLVAGLTTGSAVAQAFKVTADEPVFDELQSPEFGGKKAFKPKEWLEIEARVMVQQSPKPASATCDRIKVTWYVAVQNPEKARTFLLFTEAIEYVNIPLDEEVYCSVYLSPASVRRILGAARNPSKAVEVVGYEVEVNGNILASVSSNRKFKPGWWNTASPSLIKSNVVPLLNKTETPFAHMWWDRYAEVDSKASAK